MATRFVRIDLSTVARDFRPIAVEPGVPLLDHSNANSRILFKWLGGLVADPEWEGESVDFFVRDDHGGRLEEVVCQPASDEDLGGPLRRDLEALRDRIAKAKPEVLQDLQRELALPFPLLSDDRAFSAHYGVEAPAEGETAPPALFLVDRRQRVAWAANPAPAMDEALAAVDKALAELPGPTSNYPKMVVNRIVNWWVNTVSRRRPAGTAG